MWKQKNRPKTTARSYALWLLGRKPYAVLALRQRLEKRGYSVDEASDAVNYLAEIGYLNDQVYAADFVSTRAQAGNGPRKLSWELKSRGISAEAAGQALGNLDLTQLRAQALIVAKRRLGRVYQGDPKARVSLLRYLLQRGYEYDLAKEVVAELLACLDSDGQNS